MNESKIKKIESKVTVRLNKVLTLSIFDEPRPKYVSKVKKITTISRGSKNLPLPNI